MLRLWDEIDAFKEQLRRTEGRPEYIFYDGPPFATGLPHYGHLLAGTLKVGDTGGGGGGGAGRWVAVQWAGGCFVGGGGCRRVWHCLTSNEQQVAAVVEEEPEGSPLSGCIACGVCLPSLPGEAWSWLKGAARTLCMTCRTL